MAEYRLSPAAERDLEGIWKYTRREWSLEQAERYTDLLTAAFQVLAEAPKSVPACDHIRSGYRRRNVERSLKRAQGWAGIFKNHPSPEAIDGISESERIGDAQLIVNDLPVLQVL